MPKRKRYQKVTANEHRRRQPMILQEGQVSLGSDCTGLDTVALAAAQIGLRPVVEFASEIDGPTRRLLLKNHKPNVLYQDMKLRDPLAVPAVQIYSCGFPCQPVSSQGAGLGRHDPRTKVLKHVFRYLRAKRPAIVMLENVRGLLAKKHRPGPCHCLLSGAGVEWLVVD